MNQFLSAICAYILPLQIWSMTRRRRHWVWCTY